MQIPNQVNNYSIWLGGNRFIGMADVTLPNLHEYGRYVKRCGLGGRDRFSNLCALCGLGMHPELPCHNERRLRAHAAGWLEN